MFRIIVPMLALFAFHFGLPVAALAVGNDFRRPLDDVLSPAISAHYDDDATWARAKNYACGTNAVYDGHRGTDFRAVVGTSVFAAKAGKLYSRFDGCPTYGYYGSTCGGGFGNHVRIDHESPYGDWGGLTTIYAHLKAGTAAAVGDVTCGDKIGETGTSGNSTGPHLHFEVRKYPYPYNDPFAGACGGDISFWVEVKDGIPSARCA